jgi:hypothetical protein
MSVIFITGFSAEEVNGYYTRIGTSGGYPVYKKGDYYLIYKAENGPYSFVGAYYVAKVVRTGLSVPKVVYFYQNESTSVTTGTWNPLRPQTANEAGTGDAEFLSSSSSDESGGGAGSN